MVRDYLFFPSTTDGCADPDQVSAILDELLMYFIFYACSLPRPEAKSKQIIIKIMAVK
jgi:hypothetical protein